jgi:hypothetical protein
MSKWCVCSSSFEFTCSPVCAAVTGGVLCSRNNGKVKIDKLLWPLFLKRCRTTPRLLSSYSNTCTPFLIKLLAFRWFWMGMAEQTGSKPRLALAGEACGVRKQS